MALPPELCGWKGNHVDGMRRNLPSEGRSEGVGSEEVESLLDHASNQGNWLWAVLGWRLSSWEAAHLCSESVLGQSHFPELLCILACLLTSDLPPTSPSLSHATPSLPSTASPFFLPRGQDQGFIQLNHLSLVAMAVGLLAVRARGEGPRRCAQQPLLKTSESHWPEYL